MSGFLTVRIAISAEAFKAIETIRATLPLGLVKYERDRATGGWFFVAPACKESGCSSAKLIL